MERSGIVAGAGGLAAAEGHPGDEGDGYVRRAWRSLTDVQRQLSARLAESSAGLCSYTDHQVGRLLQHLEESGQLDDTIVVVGSANATVADRGPGQPRGALADSELAGGWPGQAGGGATGGGQASGGHPARGAWALPAPDAPP